MTSEQGRAAAGDGPATKVARVVERYDLAPLGDDLVRAWTAEGADRRSLRELATDVNRAIVRAALTEAGFSTLDGEAENVHRLLTGGDVSEGNRLEARRRLEREGVDVEALLADFVSHQAVHTYLRRVRGASRRSDGPDLDDDVGTVRSVQGRLRAVTETTLARHDDALDVADGEAIVTIAVLCRECGEQVDLGDLVAGATCRCEPPTAGDGSRTPGRSDRDA